ncbi:FMN-dependent NADH-azoreductase [Mycoplasma anatis]|uniref:FMN-dependent NADH-azoreductase n=1 Tax=Mycoplasmopsis anatis TaxID=171279 RepID=A0A9Q3L857_9BACT|nr:FMN-dependent NADH-azoreductase [Mycoplasmopsis anatis]MBW0596148.1 FMN-dependent NADH-azoreductase [Mycoplasmopsis anatis]MBW0596832.1 FMN-dependent NADH-azoreductase [Mycoplasmopsis anatis]MBW0597644.1 FMN-dependent NADH-azoreductase [Mycoplasmopsis anatis]MBW0599542.1 FMN-dependent NADH-azoreductase [Mycoplasmopsis anatis]MBW0600506.1 FMN-dependent NADH-azoreductase [Mycoplasmopsis anatis]
MKVLVLKGHLVADANSFSNKVVDYLINKVQSKYVDSEIEVINLADTKLSEVFLTQKSFTTYYSDVESSKWIAKMKEVDKVIISVPMINFGPSIIVKNFIDAISVADQTFSYKYSKKGDAIGLLTNIDVTIIASQGAPEGWYLWGNHLSWLEGTFKFLGAKKIQSLLISGTKVNLAKSLNNGELIDEYSKRIDSLVENL